MYRRRAMPIRSTKRKGCRSRWATGFGFDSSPFCVFPSHPERNNCISTVFTSFWTSSTWQSAWARSFSSTSSVKRLLELSRRGSVASLHCFFLFRSLWSSHTFMQDWLKIRFFSLKPFPIRGQKTDLWSPCLTLLSWSQLQSWKGSRCCNVLPFRQNSQTSGRSWNVEKSLVMNEKMKERDNEINNVKEMLMQKDIEIHDMQEALKKKEKVLRNQGMVSLIRKVKCFRQSS